MERDDWMPGFLDYVLTECVRTPLGMTNFAWRGTEIAESVGAGK